MANQYLLNIINHIKDLIKTNLNIKNIYIFKYEFNKTINTIKTQTENLNQMDWIGFKLITKQLAASY